MGFILVALPHLSTRFLLECGRAKVAGENGHGSSKWIYSDGHHFAPAIGNVYYGGICNAARVKLTGRDSAAK